MFIKQKFIWLTIFFILLAITGLKFNNRAEPIFGAPEYSLPLIQDEKNGSIDIHVGRKLIIAFSPSDCGVCLTVLERLNNLYKSEKNSLPIIGIIDTPYNQVVDQMLDKYQLKFPVIHDSSSVIKSNLSLEISADAVYNKPILTLLNEGKIELGGIVGDPEYIKVIQKILNKAVKKGGSQL